jgi:hypothetical protein
VVFKRESGTWFGTMNPCPSQPAGAVSSVPTAIWAIVTAQPVVPVTITLAAAWNSWNGLLIMLRHSPVSARSGARPS